MKNDIKINQTGRSLLLSCAKDTPSSFERCVQNGYTSEKVASRFAQTGRSMIEMLGVLAIIGVLSVGGIAGYSKAMTQYRVNKTIEQINTIAAGIQTLYANQNDYTGLSYDVLKKAKIVPEEMIIENASGPKTAIGVYLSIRIFHDLDGFTLATSRGIPTDVCIYLATHNWQDNSNLVAIGRGSIPNTSNCETTDFIQCMSDGPVSLEKATAWCTINGPALAFTFR